MTDKTDKTKILLFSEGVTLSQIVRLVTLGRALCPEQYDVTFACSQFDERVFGGTSFRRRIVHSLDPAAVLAAVRSGNRLYDKKTLLHQVDEDLAVFDEVRPELVVGDFRWSLAVSAKVYGVPHAALINAYWSPYAERKGFPVPDHPIVRVLGEEMTARYFPVALPRVFAHFAEPLNAARRAHGLPAIGSLLEVLTYGDYVLYPDPPQLVPTLAAPRTHEHLGHVPWAPEGALPLAISSLPSERPVVYATLGSSGSIDTLPLVAEALGRLNVTGLIATAGRKTLTQLPSNVHATDFVPGDLAARRASLVISNGGSSTSYQALAEGTPVLGLPSNLDQYLAMTALEAVGAGVVQRARSATSASIEAAIETLLSSSSHRDAAQKLQRELSISSAVTRFQAFVARVTSSRTSRGSHEPSSLRLLSVVLCLAAALFGGRVRAEGLTVDAPGVVGEIRFSAHVLGSGGRVVCSLFRESGWLKQPVLIAKATIQGHEATCVFAAVPAGAYAVVAFHDQNDNGDIDTFVGIPTEDWCASRNAKGRFGPPRFGDAKFLSRGGVVQLTGSM